MSTDIETLHNEVIQSLQISIIAIDSKGYIIAINQAWEHFSAYHNIPTTFQWIGVNLFQICEASPRTQDHDPTIMNSFHCLLEGHTRSFSHEFSMETNQLTEWFTLVAYPLFKNETSFIKGAVISFSNITLRKQMELNFHESLSQIRTLRGLIPICAVCKRIKDDDLWNDIECFLEKHTYAEFTHDICPDCIRRLYPKYSSVLDRLPES